MHENLVPESKNRKHIAGKKYTPSEGECDDCGQPFTSKEGLTSHFPCPANNKDTRKVKEVLDTSTSSPPHKKWKDMEYMDFEEENEIVLNCMKGMEVDEKTKSDVHKNE